MTDTDTPTCPLCNMDAHICASLTVEPTTIRLYCRNENRSVTVSMEDFNQRAHTVGVIPAFDKCVWHVVAEILFGHEVKEQ